MSQPAATGTSLRTAPAVKVYSRTFLSIYDFLIIGVLGRFVWRCSAEHYLAAYRSNISRNHADFGTGTGYFLDRCGIEPDGRKLALFDLNQNCLDYSSVRLARFAPQTYVQDALKDMPDGLGPFESIGMGGLLHCLPGSMSEKCRAFDSIRPIASSRVRVFGYTLVGRGTRTPLLAKATLAVLNRIQVIDNTADSVESLRHELERRFESCQVVAKGCMAFFVAENYLPQPTPS